MPESPDPGRSIRINEQIRNSIWEAAALLYNPGMCRSDLRCCSTQLPVRWPGATVADGQRESAGPTRQTGKAPAANDGIGQAVRVCSKVFALPERQLEDKVRVDLVGSIKVRGATLLVGNP